MVVFLQFFHPLANLKNWSYLPGNQYLQHVCEVLTNFQLTNKYDCGYRRNCPVFHRQGCAPSPGLLSGPAGVRCHFAGPSPDDVYFGIVERGKAMKELPLFTALGSGEGLRGFEIQDIDGYVLYFGRTI